ncbi:uncharacterized protein LOC130738288 [Lotus japonicus]|uniref:uncharacterized protein LOC130738288 n=1 Tax=Lotus japonicus TaxID=34305 RepID=UPI0025909837|nr:uncharacterized protein LOC130738288 [Lotus japonicus]
MERLALLIQKRVNEGSWHPICITKEGIGISHLFFADDVLLFCQAKKSQMKVVADTLRDFCDTSGMRVNLDKSRMFCTKTIAPTVQDELSSLLGIKRAANLGKYLGISLLKGRVTRDLFLPIMEKISARLASWKTRMLNRAGKLCLAKSVLTSIPVYTMQSLWLPQTMCDFMDKKIRSCLWAKSTSDRGWSLVPWHAVTQPKEEGGLGLRSARLNNIAMLGTLVDNLLHDGTKPWVRAISEKYLKTDGVLQGKYRSGDSYVWKSIVRAMDHVGGGFQPFLGDGLSSVWYANWLGTGRLCDRVPFVNIADTHLKVADLWHGGAWNLAVLYTVLPPQIIEEIVRIRVPFTNSHPDSIQWTHTADANAACSRCNADVEDLDHLFRGCPNSRDLWHSFRRALPATNATLEFSPWLAQLLSHRHASLAIAVLWWCWRWRNQRIFATQDFTLNQVLRFILRDEALRRNTLQFSMQNDHLGSMGTTTSVTIFVDGSWNPIVGRMGCAAVVRDSRGAWLSATSVSYSYGSAFLAEILAVELGLRHALDIGHKSVSCLSDCSQALQALHAGTNITSYWNREEICRVRDIIATLQDVRLQQIDRVKNNTADKLAREAGRLGSPVQVWKHPPSFVYDSLFLDAHKDVTEVKKYVVSIFKHLWSSDPYEDPWDLWGGGVHLATGIGSGDGDREGIRMGSGEAFPVPTPIAPIACSPCSSTINPVPLRKPAAWSIFLKNMIGEPTFNNSLWLGIPELLVSFKNSMVNHSPQISESSSDRKAESELKYSCYGATPMPSM